MQFWSTNEKRGDDSKIWSADYKSSKKIYRLKEDQAFSLSLELGLKRKSCVASVCRFPPSLCWRGWWFGRYCFSGENALERMRDIWFCGSFGTVPLNFLLHVKNCTSENCKFTLSFLANWNLYPMTESTERSPTHKWRKYILRVEGGFHVQYRGNVHLWPKSDDSKKSLVLFYLFTLWQVLSVAISNRANIVRFHEKLAKIRRWKHQWSLFM